MPDTPIFDALLTQYTATPSFPENRAWCTPEDAWALEAYWRGFGYYLTLKERCHG